MARHPEFRPPFALTVFGAVELTLAGVRVSLTPLQEALLGLLAGHGAGGVPRGRALPYLWSHGDESTVRRRMSQLLYSLHERVRRRDLIVAEGDRLRLDPGVARTDLQDLTEAMEARDLAHAVELVERGFLSQLAPVPTRELEGWIADRNRHFRGALRSLASEICTRGRDTSDSASAEEAAAALLRLDPHDEHALQRMVRSLGVQGRVTESLAAFRSFGERMRSVDPAWEPLEATRVLVRRIEGLDPFESAVGVRSPAGIAAPGRLIGRSEEMKALRSALGGRPEASVRTLSIVGPPGIGKTRLAREALRPLPLAGTNVLMGSCALLHRDVSLSPIIDALGAPWVASRIRGLAEPWRAILLSLLPELHSDPGPLPIVPTIRDSEAPRRLREAFTQLLDALASDAPLVLFLDDFQWADDATRVLIGHVQRRGTVGSFTILLTVRDDGATGIGAPVRGVPDAARPIPGPSFRHSTLRIGPLSGDHARELLATMDPEGAHASIADAVMEVGSGNPRYLQMAHAALTSDASPPGGNGAGTGSRLLRPVVHHRFDELDSGSRQVLALLSLAEVALSLDEVAWCLEKDPRDAAAYLDRLSALGWVVVHSGGVSLSSRILGEALRDLTPPGTRSFLHGRLAGCLESRAHRHRPALIALHHLHAGAAGKALPYMLEAAREAAGLGTYADTVRLLSRAVAAANDARTRVTLLRALGRLQCRAGNVREGMRALARARRGGRALGDGDEEAMEDHVVVLEARAGDPGRDPDGLARRAAALTAQVVPSSRLDLVARLQDLQLHLFDESGDVAAAEDVLGRSGEMARRPGLGDRERLSFLLTSCASIHYGDPTEAAGFIREAVTVARRVGEAKSLLQALNWELIDLYHRGRLNQADGIRSRRAAASLARACGDHIITFRHALNSAVWYLDTFDFEGAEIALDRAEALLGDSVVPQARRNLRVNQGELALARREWSRASSRFREALRLSPSCRSDQGSLLALSGLGLASLASGAPPPERDVEALLRSLRDHWTVDPTLVFRYLLSATRGTGRFPGAMSRGLAAVDRIGPRSLPWRIRLTLLLAEERADAGLPINRSVLARLLEDIARLDLAYVERRIRSFLEGGRG